MAQKKVILKDGADELLPKTSASMVFTESGQTVEAALQNAGSGGTVDSGIADITSIYSKMDIQNGGILGNEDLNTLKGYISAGKVLKISMEGTTVTFDYNTSSSTIVLSSSPMVYMGMYGVMMVISILVDSETGEYVGVTDESSGQLVQQMIPSNVNAAQICTMNGYAKPSAYSDISPTDSINTAIGKLEAGIGSGGSGGGDNIYWLPADLISLTAGATHEEILAALGGSLESIFEAAKEGKEFLIKMNLLNTIVHSIHVDVNFPSGVSVIYLNFIYCSSNSQNENSLYTIRVNTSSPSESYVKRICPEGYSLNSNFISFNSDISSDSISGIVGGEKEFKRIIQAVKDGNRLVIIDDENGINQDLSISFYSIDDNGDMQLVLSGIGPNLWGGYGGILTINYTKSSNTFSCNVIPISMGS